MKAFTGGDDFGIGLDELVARRLAAVDPYPDPLTNLVKQPQGIEQHIQYFCGDAANPTALNDTEPLRISFYKAVAADDTATQHRLLKSFFMPYLAIRNRVEGYGVSIIKAGARIVGHDGGPVRAPLTDLKPHEVEELAALIKKLGPQ